jgi:hypothetical protein
MGVNRGGYPASPDHQSDECTYGRESDSPHTLTTWATGDWFPFLSVPVVPQVGGSAWLRRAFRRSHSRR